MTLSGTEEPGDRSKGNICKGVTAKSADCGPVTLADITLRAPCVPVLVISKDVFAAGADVSWEGNDKLDEDGVPISSVPSAVSAMSRVGESTSLLTTRSVAARWPTVLGWNETSIS